MAICLCAIICYQDLKERMVFWFLFPLLVLVLGFLFYDHATLYFFLFSLLTNALLVSLMLVLLYFCARVILKKAFLNHSLGLGDIFFFYAMAVGFPTITFSILFAGAIFFSLISYLVLKKRFQKKTVPLAGLMGFYLAMVFLSSLFFKSTILYHL